MSDTPQSKHLFYYTDWKHVGWFANPDQFRKEFPKHGKIILRVCCPEDVPAPNGYQKTGKGLANDPAERLPNDERSCTEPIMSQVTFIPKAGTKYDETGWPEEVRGDGFIDLKLWEVNYTTDSATYRDQYRDEYEFYGVDEGEWDIEVRED